MQFRFIDTYEALQTDEHVWKMPSGGKRGGKLLRNEQGGTVKVDKVCHVLDTLSLVDDELCKSVTMFLCAHEKFVCRYQRSVDPRPRKAWPSWRNTVLFYESGQISAPMGFRAQISRGN